MKLKNAAILSAIATLLLFGNPQSADATTLITSFEQDEGFTSGKTIWSHPDWRQSSSDLHVVVSNAYALSGTQSAALSNSATPYVARLDLAGNDPFIYASWSFTNPTLPFSNQGMASWVYIFLYDETTGTTRSLQFNIKYGATEQSDKTIQYRSVDADGNLVSLVYNDTAGNIKGWDSWNTIAFILNPEAKTYSLSLNGTVPEALSAISLGNWNISRINGTQLVTPYAGTTYYDSITFSTTIPEPSATQTALYLFGASLCFWKFGRRPFKKIS